MNVVDGCVDVILSGLNAGVDNLEIMAAVQSEHPLVSRDHAWMLMDVCRKAHQAGMVEALRRIEASATGTDELPEGDVTPAAPKIYLNS